MTKFKRSTMLSRVCHQELLALVHRVELAGGKPALEMVRPQEGKDCRDRTSFISILCRWLRFIQSVQP